MEFDEFYYRAFFLVFRSGPILAVREEKIKKFVDTADNESVEKCEFLGRFP